jgi:hypothetical protein
VKVRPHLFEPFQYLIWNVIQYKHRLFFLFADDQMANNEAEDFAIVLTFYLGAVCFGSFLKWIL